jgi:hypothetical protein
MKIDPTERFPQFPRQAVDNDKKNQGVSGFDAVLRNTIQKPSQSEGCMGASIRRMTGPLAPMGVQPGPDITADAVAQKLLDLLEDYQQLLADPAVTLKGIQPAVEQMEKQVAGTRELISGMPQGHPLKTIIQDTLTNINQEIERFSSGYYVDGY